MGVRFPGGGNNVLVNTVLGTNVETILLTTTPLNISLDFAQIFIFWFCTVVTAASTTSMTVRLRRGATAAGLQLVGTQSIVVSAGAGALISGCYIDTPGAVAGQQYTLTATTAGAAGPGSINDGAIISMAL